MKEVVVSQGGDSDSATANRDSAIPYLTAFIGNEKDTVKRTSQFRT